MADQLDLSVLSWMEGAVGGRLLGYLLGCQVADLQSLIVGDSQLAGRQVEVVGALSSLRGKIPQDFDEASASEAARNWVSQVGEDGKSVARHLHDYVTASEQVPTGQDDLERALASVAADAYPGFLLPPDPFSLPMMEETSFRVSSIIHQLPQSKSFSEAALCDPVLKKIFAVENEHTGHIAMIYRNTGSGGGLQLSLLADTVLRAAWRKLIEAGEPSPGTFASEAINQLRIVRGVLAGESHSALAKLAFTGVLLPEGAQLQLGDCMVRPVTDADRKIAPATLKAQLSGTDSSGNNTVINYDGDAILEYQFPYKVRVGRRGFGGLQSWPDDMRPPAGIEAASLRLRFSLMLAVERESRAQLVQTWRTFEEPFSIGRSLSWSDPRQGTGIMPIQLTEDEVVAWGEWYERLSTAHMERIELALSRILRAIAERREPSDVLIDSVIAWENLFGTKEGEPTFRVTTCLAKLLEDSFEKRKELRTKLGKIYTLRSNVVHGSASLKESDYPKCQAALDVAVNAIRVLATKRTDILALPDGAARSTALVLED